MDLEVRLLYCSSFTSNFFRFTNVFKILLIGPLGYKGSIGKGGEVGEKGLRGEVGKKGIVFV